MCGSEHTLGGPISYRTLNSSSKSAELKHTLIHKCTSFSFCRLFHRFLMSARSGFIRYHNTLSKKISCDCTSLYIDGLMHPMHSVFAESLNLSEVKDSGTQTETILYYIVAKNRVLRHWWGVYAIL